VDTLQGLVDVDVRSNELVIGLSLAQPGVHVGLAPAQLLLFVANQVEQICFQ